MKTLIKIRATQLKKHPCETFLSYISIGLIMLIFGLIFLYQDVKKKFFGGMGLLEQKYSTQINKAKPYIFNLALISEDNQIIESFKQFSKPYQNLNFSYFKKEK